MARVLVLGANGFIGRGLVASLSRAGHELAVGTRRPWIGNDGIRSWVSAYDRPEHFRAALDGVDVCVHAASASTPASTAGAPLAELEGNLRTTLALLEALQELPPCQLLYVSSGGTLYGDLHARMADESDALMPRSYHGAGKAAAEHFVRAWATQHQRSAVLLRPSNVYGPGQPLRAGFGIIPHAFARALDGAPLTLYGDGSATRDYLYLDDLLALCTAILARAPTGPGAQTYNASASQGVRLAELLQVIEAVSGRRLERIWRPAREVDIHFVVPDSQAARRDFRWAPTVALREGIGRSWERFLQHASRSR